MCDAGCGKGRYLKRLTKEFPDNEYYAFDISEKVMSDVDIVKEKRLGSLTSIPYQDERFDIVYTCEALEHAINIHSAFKELFRIVKNDGKLIIIDKPIEKSAIGNI